MIFIIKLYKAILIYYMEFSIKTTRKKWITYLWFRNCMLASFCFLIDLICNESLSKYQTVTKMQWQVTFVFLSSLMFMICLFCAQNLTYIMSILHSVHLPNRSNWLFFRLLSSYPCIVQLFFNYSYKLQLHLKYDTEYFSPKGFYWYGSVWGKCL